MLHLVPGEGPTTRAAPARGDHAEQIKGYDYWVDNTHWPYSDNQDAAYAVYWADRPSREERPPVSLRVPCRRGATMATLSKAKNMITRLTSALAFHYMHGVKQTQGK